jgi:quercetin dioxygenase-like cupin family protein
VKITRLRAAAIAAAAPRADRPATAIVADSADARIVLFRIDPGQEVTPHTNASTVLMTVIDGRGVVSGPDGDHDVHMGDFVAYEPNELHGMRATDERLVILATIAPRPGTR